MKVVLVWIGKTSEKYIVQGIENYRKRIERYHNFQIDEISPVKNAEKLSPSILKQKEASAIKNRIQDGDFVILLDENGKEYNSVEFASLIEKKMIQSVKRLVFIIGGAYGHSDELKNKYSNKLSLSQMTFSHQVIRLIFMEQLYRANTIIRNEPYHNS